MGWSKKEFGTAWKCPCGRGAVVHIMNSNDSVMAEDWDSFAIRCDVCERKYEARHGDDGLPRIFLRVSRPETRALLTESNALAAKLQSAIIRPAIRTVLARVGRSRQLQLGASRQLGLISPTTNADAFGDLCKKSGGFPQWLRKTLGLDSDLELVSRVLGIEADAAQVQADYRVAKAAFAAEASMEVPWEPEPL